MISDALLKKYTDVAKLYQSDEFYQGGQSVVISANDLLAIIERLQQAEASVDLLVKERFKALDKK